MTDWLCEYMKNYVKIAKFFQNRKTIMLKKFSSNKSAKWIYFAKFTFQNSIKVEILFFQILQKNLFSFQFFVHFNNSRQLYMNVDINKKNINVIIYHSKQIINDYFSCVMIELIMFLNKRITDFESQYWSIELKLVDLI